MEQMYLVLLIPNPPPHPPAEAASYFHSRFVFLNGPKYFYCSVWHFALRGVRIDARTDN